MHIIWKRPDGFQNAHPEDFRRVPLSNAAQLWLHRHELDWYPFQVSGDWAGQEQTVKLNRLVNLVDATDAAWLNFLERYNDDELGSQDQSSEAACEGIVSWLEALKEGVKGNTWEVEIMRCALGDVQTRVTRVKEMKSAR
jgi:hypothetical protein